jgi:DNA-binding PadR family transcriptional regulator
MGGYLMRHENTKNHFHKKHHHDHERLFGRGEIPTVLLNLLTEKDMHGYEMIKELEEKSSGFYKPSAGSIYPTLQLLGDRGYIQALKDDRKTVYKITEEGKAFLAMETERKKDINKAGMFSDNAAIQSRKHHHQMEFENKNFREKVRGIAHLLFKAGDISMGSADKMVVFEELLGNIENTLDEYINKCRD